VSSYAGSLSGSNAGYWATTGALPYHWFPIDIDQYNLIEGLASQGMQGIAFFYCAPTFHTRSVLQGHYVGNTVMNNATFIDVQGLGQLVPGRAHKIIYTAADGYLCSEPRAVRLQSTVKAQQLEPLTEATVDSLLRYVLQAVEAKNVLADFPRWLVPEGEFEPQEFEQKVALLGTLLGRFYSISLLAFQA
jgi:hypothetical protein